MVTLGLAVYLLVVAIISIAIIRAYKKRGGHRP